MSPKLAKTEIKMPNSRINGYGKPHIIFQRFVGDPKFELP